MALGKNKLLRFCRVYLGGYDVSGDTRTFNTLENSMSEVDFTGLGQDGNYLANQVRKLGVSGYQALMNDLAAGSASTLLNPAPQNLNLSVFIGGGAAPAVGDMAYLLPSIQMGATSDFSATAGVLSADFLPGTTNVAHGNPFGRVHLPLTALTATDTGTNVNNAAATATGGALGILHVTVSSGGTWSFVIQQSADGSTNWTTLITFTLTGNAVTSEAVFVTGAVQQYTRTLFTRTSGTLTAACAMARLAGV